ncbi:MAG TPA: prolipoprotein diacylglyceryl transferase family protein [Pyrinomonadaceae bacterium]|jgi:prolipoprotein diacylglyceryltransferase|nr:prolipoprotein diacylglyceryl transferase family protein [Pyrinomonadaceae bacterium]
MNRNQFSFQEVSRINRPLDLLNQWFDALPRPRLSFLGREVPAFRTCGIAGFYMALITVAGATLLAGRSLAVGAALAIVSGLSFFVYARLRKWITGQEELVLLEQVWFALSCNALALWLMREPFLPYLDIVSVALCPFLAAGRIGCTLVGCCHGHPSSLGITYDEACARDGFSSHLVGVRLFPVPAIEAFGLLLIGACGLAALPFANPGRIFAWYLVAYSVIRFGLESLRADRRPHFLGLSQARWMCLLELGLAIVVIDGSQRRPLIAMAAILLAILAGVLLSWLNDPRRRLLSVAHARELRVLAHQQIESEARSLMIIAPAAHTTSAAVSIAASIERRWPSPAAHISLRMFDNQKDLWLQCELAARAFPGLILEAAQFTDRCILHLLVARPLAEIAAGSEQNLRQAQQLYGRVVRDAQQVSRLRHVERDTVKSVSQNDPGFAVPEDFTSAPPAIPTGFANASSWYFTLENERTG